jgi:Na+-transporting NADH:ubiquinone oxidoreductase subunit C
LNINSNKYTFTFAVIVCVVSAVLLSGVSEGLRKKKEINAEFEVKKNILKAVHLREELPVKVKPQEVFDVYDQKVQEFVIDGNGNIIEGRKPSDIKDKEAGAYPLYIYKEGQEIVSYAFPIVGQGLWSTLYGYLAIEADGETVRGITFYKHGETPGLGAEIEKDWFQANFKGKKIWSVTENKMSPIIVVKGKAVDLFKDPESLSHHVDGITAATLTGQGVTDLLKRWITTYDVYFSKVRKI